MLFSSMRKILYYSCFILSRHFPALAFLFLSILQACICFPKRKQKKSPRLSLPKNVGFFFFFSSSHFFLFFFKGIHWLKKSYSFFSLPPISFVSVYSSSVTNKRCHQDIKAPINHYVAASFPRFQISRYLKSVTNNTLTAITLFQ